jgi:hypothetical protein
MLRQRNACCIRPTHHQPQQLCCPLEEPPLNTVHTTLLPHTAKMGPPTAYVEPTPAAPN